MGAQPIERPTPDPTPRAITRPPSPAAASSVVEPAPVRPVQLAHPGVLDRADLADRSERRLPSNYRLVALVLGDRVEAEDATHEAILSAWARAGTLRDPAAFDDWFERILVNVCRDRLRHRRVLRLIDLEAAGSIAAPDEIRSVGTRDTVRAAFARLNPHQGLAVVLRNDQRGGPCCWVVLDPKEPARAWRHAEPYPTPTRQPLDCGHRCAYHGAVRPGKDQTRCSRRGGTRTSTRGARSAC